MHSLSAMVYIMLITIFINSFTHSFIYCFTSRSKAMVILGWVVYWWRNQCIPVGQDSAL